MTRSTFKDVLIGRDAELRRVATLLDDARRGRSGTLVVVGDVGMGKTALLEEAKRAAADMRILAATGVESESELPFASLHALLRPLLGLLPRIPEAQARSLAAALAIEDGPPDALAVNAGTLSLLVEAAEETPVAIVVDDIHWLDQASAEVLAFTARRLTGEELAVLVSARPDTATVFEPFPRLELGLLAPADARRVLEARAKPVPPVDVVRFLAAAAGNPLALLELPVELAREEPTYATLQDRLRHAFSQRLDDLSARSRLGLLLAAAEPDPLVVRRAAEALGLFDPLLEAEEAGLIRVQGDEVVFRHPVVRSIVYANSGIADRGRAHQALADALPSEADRDRRAWHLAAAATAPDEELAALLEETADRATTRGGHLAAARALERAARLSRDPDAASRRLCKAARAAFWTGDVDWGGQLAEEAIASSEDPLLRADALLEYATIQPMRGTAYDEDRLLMGIGELERLDPDRATRLLMFPVSWRLEGLDVTGATELVPRLEEAARRAGRWWRPRGLAQVAEAHLASGDPDRFRDVFAEVLDDAAVTAAFAGDLLWAEQYDTARRALETTLRDGRSTGNRMRVIWNQTCLAQLELRVGRLPQATLAAAEAITLGEAHGAVRFVCTAQGALAGVQAWQGEVDACRRTSTEAIETARRLGSIVDEFAVRSALGLLALGLGRAAEAIDELAPAAGRWHETSFAEPSGVAFVADLVEAYAHAGDAEEAQTWLTRFRAIAERSRRRWALAASARCEGLLADQDTFADSFERSLALLEPSPLTLDRARTKLAYGERLRRQGRRREARTQLRAAYATFAAASAGPWQARTAAELRAAGEQVADEIRPLPDLTPQELQIAHLVADGKTNKEIAAALFLSPKTIEYHLANTFRKLDIHSRAELARIVARDTAAPSAAPSVFRR